MVRPAPPERAAAAAAAAVAVAAVAAAAAACSGKARTDGTGSAGPGGASGSSGSAVSTGAAGSAGSAGARGVPATPLIGDAQIRVEWADVPMAARASAGRTPCNTPRAPAVAPTATWGIPDAIVVVEGVRADAAEARGVLADCALSPRVAVGASLLVESAADRPASVTLAKRADLSKPEAMAAAAAPPRVLRLPIAGHAVAVPLDAGGVYELSTADKDPETAWIAAPRPGAAVEVTDAQGQVVLRKLPAGAHAVTAWLPPRAGQPARIARGTVTVTAGELAELTLSLAPVP